MLFAQHEFVDVGFITIRAKFLAVVASSFSLIYVANLSRSCRHCRKIRFARLGRRSIDAICPGNPVIR